MICDFWFLSVAVLQSFHLSDQGNEEHDNYSGGTKQ